MEAMGTTVLEESLRVCWRVIKDGRDSEWRGNGHSYTIGNAAAKAIVISRPTPPSMLSMAAAVLSV